MMSDFCEIIVKDCLDIDWSGWFEGLTIAPDDKSEPMLSGQIRDRAALYGIISKIRDMGLSLISVKYIAGEPTIDSASEDDS